MKKYAIWLQTEYKRAAAMLPSILTRAIILTAVCLAAAGIIAFCTQKVFGNNGKEVQKLRIGYVAEDNMLTELAVSYVQGMESVQSLCSLEPVTEQEGKRLLESGELSGLIVLPENVINEILSGSNKPARLYLRGDGSAAGAGGFQAVGGMLFEELSSAGMGMLGTAQAEIYAAGAILEELAAVYGTDDTADTADTLQTMYDDINKFNLGIVTAREELFEIKNLSLTGNDTYAVYYGSALLTVYGMFAGLFFGKFCKRPCLQQTIAARRMGVGYIYQLLCRCMAGAILMLLVLMLPFILLLVPQINAILCVNLTLSGMLGIILIILYLTVYNMLIYEVVEKRESALVAIGILGVFQAYFSGCLIPSVLLPNVVAQTGGLLPASYIKAGFTMLITGETRQLYHVARGLVLWTLILFAATLLCMQAGERKKAFAGSRKTFSGMYVPSVCMVMFRRLLHKKSIWLCMGLVVVLSVVIVKAEEHSETRIKAAVYDESGAYQELLEGYEGLVSFDIYDSSEEVAQAVLNGDAECGYILPQNLMEMLIKRRANKSVTVYQDADAVAVPVVNEILFERIFRQVSLEWYKDYMMKNDVVAGFGADRAWLEEKTDENFNRQLSATFRMEIEQIGTGSAPDIRNNRQTTYPAGIVAAAAVILCALQGTVQVISDMRNKSFYKRNRMAMSVLTIILPVMLGLLTAFLTTRFVCYCSLCSSNR